jgi:hypothetical protein
LNKHIGIRKNEYIAPQFNTNDIELNYDNMEYYMKQEIENDLGKDIYSKLLQILSKQNKDIYSFDYDNIEKTIREELTNYGRDTVENALLKIPDIYCILIKEKVV